MQIRVDSVRKKRVKYGCVDVQMKGDDVGNKMYVTLYVYVCVDVNFCVYK